MSTSFASISLRTVLTRAAFVLVPIGAVLFVLQGLATLVVERSLAIAFGSADTSHGSAWYEWDGDIVAGDVVIASDANADDAAAVRFERLHVDTPGWVWVGRHVFDRRLAPSGMDELELVFSGVRSGLGNEPTLGQLGPVGAISSSPFEAEGCMQDRLWRREDLDRMGLSLGESSLRYHYRIDNAVLTTNIVLETPGASRVAFERTGEIVPGTDIFSVSTQAGPTHLERWEVQDQGFVSARNRFCTKKDEIDLRRFIERHVEAVERILATLGLGLDPDSRIAYRRFVRDGGRLVYSVRYPQALRPEELGTVRRNGAVLHRMEAHVEHNGRGNAITWQRFDPRPLPQAGEDETTYAILSRERTAEIRGETLSAASTEATAGASGPGETATPGSIADQRPAPASEAVRMDPALATVVDPTAITSRAEPSATPPTAQPPVHTPEIVPPVAETPAPVAKPETAVAPSTAGTRPARNVATITPAPPVTRRERLDWSVLPNYRGRQVRIWTIHNPPRTVEIVSGDADSLRVSVRIGGGTAEYTIQREGFIRATLVR